MKRIILISFIAFVTNAKAQYVTIPDGYFVSYLHSLVPTAMNGSQMDTTNTFVTTTVLTINVAGLMVSNLTGVQYFKSLQHLTCTGNFAAAGLPALPNTITHLYCDNSQLFSLPALPTSLTYLDCYQNSLSNLPTLPNSLTHLDCHNCRIACFPTFPNSITTINIGAGNPYDCLPNYVLPAMNSYTTTPLCAAGNTHGCAVATGIEQYSASTNISIYPNPSNGSFVIEPNSNTKQTMQVYDVNGKLVLTQTINGKTTIDATALNEGVYNISLISNEGIVNKRVVIVR
ncbi:MAG TPA: T9SS type A sorting domain-containing protein [Bacteroidia bacterium]